MAEREQQFYEAEARLKDLARQERLEREQVQEELEQERKSLADTQAVREELRTQLAALEGDLSQARVESERLRSELDQARSDANQARIARGPKNSPARGLSSPRTTRKNCRKTFRAAHGWVGMIRLR